LLSTVAHPLLRDTPHIMSASLLGADDLHRRRTNVKNPVDLDAFNKGLYPPDAMRSSSGAASTKSPPSGAYQVFRAVLLAVWFWSCVISCVPINLLSFPLPLLLLSPSHACIFFYDIVRATAFRPANPATASPCSSTSGSRYTSCRRRATTTAGSSSPSPASGCWSSPPRNGSRPARWRSRATPRCAG
jgi:hypothetical protein